MTNSFEQSKELIYANEAEATKHGAYLQLRQASPP